MQEHHLTRAEGTMEDVTATAPIVRLIMATDTADGIMGMTMYTAVSSVVIRVAAAWTKETCYVRTKEKGSGACI